MMPGPERDLTTQAWSLTGWRPFAWKLRRSSETGGFLLPDHGPYPATLPGSVQENLRRADVVEDWHFGRGALAIEWVEHRHWMFTTTVVSIAAGTVFCADLLDYSGWVLLDGVVVGEFRGAHLPVRIPLGQSDRAGSRELALVFDVPPEGQGQMGFTSRAREAKPRYSYSWDWCVRVVPIGARGRMWLEAPRPLDVEEWRIVTQLSPDLARGRVTVAVRALGTRAGDLLRCTLEDPQGEPVAGHLGDLIDASDGVPLTVDNPCLWWPNGEGAAGLYRLRMVVERGGEIMERWSGDVGFRTVEWRPCAEAPENALPWLCVVNGRPIFLQGVNWTPVRLCYQDTTVEEIERLVGLYRDMGCNLLRVWGGAGLERPEFYAACDRAGVFVWQELPLSSSGMDSLPPEDPAFGIEMEAVARYFVRSCRHHVSLLQWCGGNELHEDEETPRGVRRRPLTQAHPLLRLLAHVVADEDSGRRFLPTSPYGPRFHSTPEEFGCGVHHEVHGPWGLDGYAEGEWEQYWRSDDSLFRGEAGVAGASRVDLILRHGKSEPIWPPDTEAWRRLSGWWTQWERLRSRFAEATLAEYVEYTRREQAEKLAVAIRETKRRFPRCGGFLIWMGHDCFPCPSNTSLIEFDHRPKPAVAAVAAEFKTPVSFP